VIIVILFALNITLGAVHLVIVAKYEKIQTNIFNENSLITSVSELVKNYNLYRILPGENRLLVYSDNKAEIDNILADIDEIINEKAHSKFIGVNNTVKSIIYETDTGIDSLRAGDIEGTSSRYTEANRKLSFVRENVADLILYEIQTSEDLRLAIQRANRLFIIFGGVLIISILFGVAGLSNMWSRNLVSPLIELTDKVASVTRGDFDIHLKQELIEGKDEVGKLASSFNVMIHAIKKNIETLNESNEEIKNKSSALANKVSEAENSRRAILNLLEDIKHEKENAESMVVQRTHELAEEKARLVASIDSLSFGFVIADKNDDILLRNPAMNKIFGFKKDPTSLHEIADALRGGGKTFLTVDPVSSCRECMELRKIVEIKDIFYGKKFLRIFCAPILSEGSVSDEKNVSDVIGYVFLVEDITEAKVMERSRDEFFSIASHELRTPLTAIRGNSEMVLDMYADKVKDPDLKEMLVDIHSASIRLIDIVNDFLEVSRIEQGKIQLKFENFNVKEIVNKVVKDMKNMAQIRNITLVYSNQNASLPMARADKGRVEQVLINLVGNSLKFTEHGGITISTEVMGNFLKISVKDTGIGISPENQTRLFRKFQQAGEDMIARDVTQGTGLGLYISQLLVSGMSGTIGVEKSAMGEGSTFAFTLPLVV
jgi:signal transduction histidine kinase